MGATSQRAGRSGAGHTKGPVIDYVCAGLQKRCYRCYFAIVLKRKGGSGGGGGGGGQNKF